MVGSSLLLAGLDQRQRLFQRGGPQNQKFTLPRQGLPVPAGGMQRTPLRGQRM